MEKRTFVYHMYAKINNSIPRLSLRAIILWIFIPIIITLVFINGILSYILAERQIKENAFMNIKDTVSQTKNYLDYRLYDVFGQLVAFENNKDTLTITRNLVGNNSMELDPNYYISMNETVENIYSAYYEVLDSILVYYNNGRFILYKKDNTPATIHFSFDEWRDKYPVSTEHALNYRWLNLHSDDVFISSKMSNKVVSLFRLTGEKDSQIRSMILFNFREEFFKEILTNAVISENGYLVLISDDGVMAFKHIDDKYKLHDKVVKYINEHQNPSGSLVYQAPGGETMMVVFDTVKINNWKIAAVFPEKEILSKAGYIKLVILYVMVFILIIAIVLSNGMARVITKPISTLINKVQKVEEGNMSIAFDDNISYEVTVLNEGITHLLAHIKNLLNVVKREEEKKRLAEMAVLQAQINPHFLYNTLYSIKQLCDMGENKNASKMILALSNFFRTGLSKGQDIITIEEEIKHVENYLIIQAMKYDYFRYSIEIDPDILLCEIVKLTLQPLVENALYHGVKGMEGGIISVTGYMVNQDIILEVRDNGAGMPVNKLEEIKQSLKTGSWGKNLLSFGVRNVHERIRKYFGEEYGLEFESESEKGTVVKIRIPVSGEQENNYV